MHTEPSPSERTSPLTNQPAKEEIFQPAREGLSAERNTNTELPSEAYKGIVLPSVELNFPEESAGARGKIGRLIGRQLARISVSLCHYWLKQSGASEGDKISVATSIINSNPASIRKVQGKLHVDLEMLAASLAQESSTKAFSLLKPAYPEEHSLHFKLAVTAIKNNEQDCLTMLDVFDAPDERRALWQIVVDLDKQALERQGHSLPMIEQTLLEKPETFLSLLSKLQAPDEQSVTYLARIIDSSPSSFLFFDGTWPALEPENARPLFTALIRSEPREALEKLDALLAWTGGSGNLPQDLDPAVVKSYWARIIRHREALGVNEQIARDLLLEKIKTHDNLVREQLSNLNISEVPWRTAVAAALVRKSPQYVSEIAGSLKITDCETLNTFFQTAAASYPKLARTWANKIKLQLDEKSQQALLDGIIASTPFAALKDALVSPACTENHLTKIAIACARKNAAKVCREISGMGITSPDLRAKVLVACAERNLWRAVDSAQKFEVAGSKGALEVFRMAVKRDPHRAIQTFIKDGLSQQEIQKALACAVSANARKTIALLAEQQLTPGITGEFLTRALRRNPGELQSAVELLKKLPAETAYPVIAAYSKGNFLKASETAKTSLRNLTLDKDLLIESCAIENFETTRLSADARINGRFNDKNFASLILLKAIQTGRWESALDAAKHLIRLTTAGNVKLGTGGALQLLDEACEKLLAREDLLLLQRENVEMLQKVRTTGCMPTHIIQSTLDHFSPGSHQFIFEVLQQAGSTVSESLFTVLLKIYEKENEILPIDRIIIKEAISQGFRGLSPELLKKLRPVFSDSVVEGRATLKQYHVLAHKVLRGEKIAPELERSPLYPNLVFQAFRPVGMTEAGVRNYLAEVKDHSAHLQNFTYPAEGYPVRLAGKTQIALRNGQTPDFTAIQTVRNIFASEHDASEALAPPVLMKRLIQGAFDQLKSEQIWGLLKAESEDSRIASFTSAIVQGEIETMPLHRLLQVIGLMNESLSVVAYDSVMEMVKKAMSTDTPVAERFIVSEKIKRQARQILRLSSDREVTDTEVTLALEQQVSKLFRRECALLQKESRKFSHHFSDLKERYVLLLSKSKPAYFGRAGAGLCSANDSWSWNSPTFLQMIMLDTAKNVIVGNIQLHLFTNRAGQPAIMARLNPTSKFLMQAPRDQLAAEMLRVVRKFASDNGLTPYLPEQTYWHQLTNRDSFAPALRKYYGKTERASVKITGSRTVDLIFRLEETPATRQVSGDA